MPSLRCLIPTATRVGWSKEFMSESQLPSVVHCVIPKGLGGALPQGDMATRAFGGGRSGLSPWCLRDIGWAEPLVSARVSLMRVLGGGGSSEVRWHRATGQETESGGARARKQ